MSFLAFWDSLVKKNPPIGNPDTKMRISSSELRRLLEQAYGHGVANQPKQSLFGSIFGGE